MIVLVLSGSYYIYECVYVCAVCYTQAPNCFISLQRYMQCNKMEYCKNKQ